MKKIAPGLLLIALALSCAVAAAQGMSSLSLAPEPDEPFQVSAVLDRTEAAWGVPFLVGIVLDAAPHYKIYRSSVKVSLAGEAPGFLVQQTEIPAGTTPPATAAEPKPEAVLTGRSVIVVHLTTLRGDATSPPGNRTAQFQVEYQGCSDRMCFTPMKKVLRLVVPMTDDARQSKPANGEYFTGWGPIPPQTDDLAKLARENREGHDFARQVSASGLSVALLFAFAWGFLVSLTPCVWPLIPIVLAVVGARAEGSGWRRGLTLSLAYVLGMALLYAGLGAVAGLLGHSVAGVAQSPWVVGLVCLVFVALALSMFGLFELRLPAALSGKLQQKRGVGILGVLVTGVFSGLVASPCVSAPLLGLFAGVATLGSVWVGALAGFVFALGMGVILIVAGTSAKALSALPRSGEWMVSVQRFFGWVMLGVAVYFSEMIVGADVYRVLMGALLAAAGVFLGALRATGEGGWPKVRQVVGILVLLLGVMYFVAGAAPLVGLAPSPTAAPTSAGEVQWLPSLDDGLAQAKAAGKPAIIDVTASWCTYCHEMDREVFAKDDTIKESRRFVMIRFDASVETDKRNEVYSRYVITGPPSFVFVRSDGTHVTVSGKQNLDAFLKLMRATR